MTEGLTKRHRVGPFFCHIVSIFQMADYLLSLRRPNQAHDNKSDTENGRYQDKYRGRGTGDTGT